MTTVRCRVIPNPPLPILMEHQPFTALPTLCNSFELNELQGLNFTSSPLRPHGPVAVSAAGEILNPLKWRTVTALSMPLTQIQWAPGNEPLPVNWFKSARPLDLRVEQPWQLWGTRGHDSYVVLQACVTCLLFDGSLHTHATAPKPLQACESRTTGS